MFFKRYRSLIVFFYLFSSVFIINIDETKAKAYTCSPTHEKIIALTYDDGPRPPYTTRILSILKRYNVPATFFVLGENVVKHPWIVQDAYQMGCEIGNHSWSHPIFHHKSCDFIRHQITQTDNIIRKTGYRGPIHFRSPYALRTDNIRKVLAESNRKHILFDVIPNDWQNPTPETIVKRITDAIKPGSIILLHDGGGIHRHATVKATELLIPALHNRGYKFVTVSTLLFLHEDPSIRLQLVHESMPNSLKQRVEKATR